jgi:hypothetical protein
LLPQAAHQQWSVLGAFFVLVLQTQRQLDAVLSRLQQFLMILEAI